ncbi:MAG: hypothetical protein AB1801_22165 [Chloroflexota bacterium]
MTHKSKTPALHPGASAQNRQSKILWPAFIAVTLIAFFFRFYRLADHPLGIFFDPAINGLDAIRLIQRGGPVIFFPTNGGREAFFMYLLVLFIRLFGTIPFSMRALTATISLLNVALLFAFLFQITPIYDLRFTIYDLRNLQPATGNSRLWFATLAGLALAVSYWHISVSRLGQRPILVPLLSVPLFWFFLTGWRTGRRRWFVLAGLVMGLAGHTYSAARLLPLILSLALLPEIFPFRSKWPYLKPRLVNFGLFGLVALVVYSPLAWYLLNHPAQFTARAGSVMVWSFLPTPTAIAAELGRNLLRVAGFFCCIGSPNPIFGQPGYPGSPLLLLPFLLIGLGAALKNRGNLFYRLVALWWLIGVMPSIIAIEAPHPWRMIVAVVPTAILIALGLLIGINWLQPRFSLPAPRFSLHLLALILILLPTPGLYRAYFMQWTDLQATRGAYDYGAVAIRDEILARPDPNLPLYLPFDRFNDSTLLYYLSGAFERQAALTVPPAGQALVLSPRRNERDAVWVRLQGHTATILPPLTSAGRQLIQTALAGDAAPHIRTADGETAARLAVLPSDPAQFLQQPGVPLAATFGPLRLTGATYERALDPTFTGFPVTLYWQIDRSVPEEYEVLLQLVDDRHRAWANGDARPNDWVYPTSFWRPEIDHIAAAHTLAPIAAEPLPPGRYWLAVSVFDPASRRRLSLSAGESDSPDTFFIGPLKVSPPAGPVPAVTETGVTFGEVARLAGAALEPPTLHPGQSIQVTLLWETLTTPGVDYTVFVHLLDSGGNLVTGGDTQPVNGVYPTTLWSPGERIVDRHALPIPATAPAGRYRLAIGLYHQPSGRRLVLLLPNGAVDAQGSFVLPQTVEVRARE